MPSKAAQSIVQYGFPKNLADWQEAPAVFTEGKLTILGHPVMEDWEAPYMEELARVATMHGGVILEVGFGLGLSATYIQGQPIDKHLVIEMNKDVFSKLSAFAQTAKKQVEPMFGLWQEVMPLIPDESIDGVLFDAYPLNANDIECHYPFFQHAYRVLKQDGILTYYANEATDFSPRHLDQLQQAGFDKIQKALCQVNPPDECTYWNSKTMIVPMIRK